MAEQDPISEAVAALERERRSREARRRLEQEEREQEAWDALVDRKKLLQLIASYGLKRAFVGWRAAKGEQQEKQRAEKEVEATWAQIKEMLGMKE